MASHHSDTPLRSGFTLIELLLSVGISATILLAVSIFLSIILSSRVKNTAVNEVESQGAFVMDVITQVIRNADSINMPGSGSDGTALSLVTLSTSTSPTVFDLSDGVIRIREGAGSAVPLTNSRVNVSAFTVTNLSASATPGTVRIVFIIAHKNPSGRNEYDFSKTFTASATLKQP